MKKLGPPERGFGSIRQLTTRERAVTELTSTRWCIGCDSGGYYRFYEKNGTGYDYGYGPTNWEWRMDRLVEFWEE